MSARTCPSQWFMIGSIGKAFGVKGYFYLDTHLESFSDKHQCLRIKNEHSNSLKVFEAKHHKKRIVLKLESIDDRTAVEKLRGQEIFADKSLSSNPYDKALGQKILDSNGNILGLVEKFCNFGAGDLLEIKSKEMSLQIPFRPEIIEQKEDHLELKVPGELYQDLWTAN
jgi:16S rRNA processing protein RimM